VKPKICEWCLINPPKREAAIGSRTIWVCHSCYDKVNGKEPR
jgi:hypothetical protein